MVTEFPVQMANPKDATFYSYVYYDSTKVGCLNYIMFRQFDKHEIFGFNTSFVGSGFTESQVVPPVPKFTSWE